MARKKTREPQGLGALIRQWERVDSFDAIEATAARTAAVLSRVRDVPATVIDSLDKLMSCDFRSHASAIFQVVSYLRNLEELERLVAPISPEVWRPSRS